MQRRFEVLQGEDGHWYIVEHEDVTRPANEKITEGSYRTRSLSEEDAQELNELWNEFCENRRMS